MIRRDKIIKILDGSATRLRESWFIKNQSDLYSSIVEYCIDIKDLSFKQKLWHWVNEHPTYYLCPCGNMITFNKNWLDGYRKGCSPKCVQSNPETKEKRKATTIEKYGVDNVAKSNEFKKKQENTNLDRYGSKSSFQNEDVKNKWKNNIIEKYGVDHISKSDIIKSKIKESNIKKYGVDSYTKTEEYIKKTRETNLGKFGVDHYSKTNEYKNSVKITNIEKYGVDHYFKSDEHKNNIKLINNEKYGVDWFCQTDEFKNKTKETNLEKRGVEHHTKDNAFKEGIKLINNEKYGVDWFCQTDEFRNKTKETCLFRYNTEHYSKTDDYKEKVIKTSMNKYGVNNFMKYDLYRTNNFKLAINKNYINYINNRYSLFNCENGHTFEILSYNYIQRIKNNIPLCTVCNPIGDSKSIKEKLLLKYIESISDAEIISSYRDVLEIDIYLPELKIGFEFNGLYWHSEKFKEMNYHIDKTNYFRDKGIRIIHIWEDDWTFSSDIIKSQINNLLNLNSQRIFARKCVVKEVAVKTARRFLDNNHIQGFVSSAFKIGLYHGEELVSIMTFDSFEGRKKMEEGGYNLNRFCNKLNTNVVGGASKLLNNFIREYDAKRIVSYADKDWSIGQLYYTLGFNNISESKPDYKYIIDNKRVHKSRYKKSNLKTILTESEQMKKDGFLKVYDCGKIKFEIKL